MTFFQLLAHHQISCYTLILAHWSISLNDLFITKHKLLLACWFLHSVIREKVYYGDSPERFFVYNLRLFCLKFSTLNFNFMFSKTWKVTVLEGIRPPVHMIKKDFKKCYLKKLKYIWISSVSGWSYITEKPGKNRWNIEKVFLESLWNRPLQKIPTHCPPSLTLLCLMIISHPTQLFSFPENNYTIVLNLKNRQAKC